MKKFSSLAAATAALMLMSYSSYALAQTAPATGTDTAAPAANTAPPAATTAPAATTTPAATQPDTNPSATEKAAPKKKKTAAKKRTRQQEIEHSIDTGTVPARYRSSVPKQYQQYIPFDKR
ncbi:hypothetical protein OZ411_02100 [Bradyrhizobium sp. Arg237L]|uniref:hypothetical protein n=1 Tax=Bradyrhizobium sp. Arg237L TaxID=3003352 RepID=UPI00249EE283|nr:hypothetical protein [Bradyrhizobium sp. Arg237L]MDI4231604.1 hypothetical protein [Bradyrhizobium sp. Arg237L]